MKHKALIIAISAFSGSVLAANNEQLQREIQRLQEQTKQLQTTVESLAKTINYATRSEGGNQAAESAA